MSHRLLRLFGTLAKVSAATITSLSIVGQSGLAVTVSVATANATTVTINWGDSSSAQTYLAGTNPTYTYASPGAYILSATASGPGGMSTQSSIVVNNPYAIKTYATTAYATGPATGLPIGSVFSLSLWVYPISLSRGQFCFFGNSSAFSAFQSNGSAQVSIGSTVFHTASRIIPLNTWTNIIFNINGASSAIYINGTQSATGSLPAVDAGSQLWIGSNGTYYFPGLIAAFRLWNSRILTSGEIAAIQTLGILGDFFSNLTGSLSTGLTYACDLNNLVEQANGYNLTAVNSPTFALRVAPAPTISSLTVASQSGFTVTLNVVTTNANVITVTTGDGSSAVSTNSMTPIITYTASGTYTVSITATGTGGVSGASTITVTV